MPITPQTLLAGMQPRWPFGKGSQTAEGVGTMHSLWKAGGFPAAGANPPLFSAGSGYVPTKATQGAFPFTNPQTGNSYFGRLSVAGATRGHLIIYDRVWACSGFATNTTSLQSISTPGTVGRYSSQEGIELWLEVYSAPGATAATWTIGYTNSAGTTGRSAVYAHPANAEAVGQMMPVAFQAGDIGVQAPTSFQCSVSSGTAGDIGITCLKRVADIPLTDGGASQDAFQIGLERVLDDACLSMLVFCTATNTGLITGTFQLTQVVP